MSVLSLGLLVPFGAGAFPDRAIAILQSAADQTPAKHITFVRGTVRETVETRAVDVDAFLSERGIVRQPDDEVAVSGDATLPDGVTIAYRPALDVAIVIDGTTRRIRSAAPNVGAVLAAQNIALGQHDVVTPAPATAIATGTTIAIERVTSWLEHVRSGIAPPVTRKFDVAMRPGSRRVIDPGLPGTKETTIAVLQPDPARAPKREQLAARVLRLPRAKIIAEGVGDGVAISEIAHRGFVGTMRLADAALRMVATAYTAACSGCSGTTASGRPAGHGVVAVDPRVIPLGSHLFIPGYGHAFAGDTGGAIRGHRIDLGFDSSRDAMSFGRRPIVVYLLK